MGRESQIFNSAKEILNQQSKQPYTDDEIIEIINFLEIFSEVICHNLTN
jgi:hypothetical protein